jgi:hypothetical protein
LKIIKTELEENDPELSKIYYNIGLAYLEKD